MNERTEHDVRAEVEVLHEFFVDWFAGVRPRESLGELVGTRFDADFMLIPPSGAGMTLQELEKSLLGAHGGNPDFRIAIRNVQVRRAEDNLILATYEEWQRNARASKPADNARITSALFRRHETLRWLHVHETWLPKSVMEAGPYDF